MGNNDNDGTYAQLIAQNTQVVFLSPNEEKVTQVYLNNKTNQLPILPLFINFASPSCDLSNDWFTPASDRLNCELVLALDLIDWLVFKQYLPFDRIVERLAIFAQRWLLVEFVTVKPLDLDSLSPDFKLIFSWYNLDNFIEALSKKFAQVKIIHQGSENNVLLLCLNEY
jgi:outer membrane lipoprotein-sorting protein